MPLARQLERPNLPVKGVESAPSSPSHRRTRSRRRKTKNARSAADVVNLTRAFWYIVALIMAAALAIDWRSKTDEAFEEGSVKIYPVELFVAPPIGFLRGVGCCPIVDCNRILIPDTRVRYDVVHLASGPVQVWNCHECKLSSTQHAQVRVERVSHRLSIQ